MQKYSTINDYTYDNAIRIKTMWNGQNRYLWVLKKDLDDFLNNSDKFKVKSHLFETNETWRSGGRKKFGDNGKIIRWQRMAVKKGTLPKKTWFLFLPFLFFVSVGMIELAIVCAVGAIIMVWIWD